MCNPIKLYFYCAILCLNRGLNGLKLGTSGPGSGYQAAAAQMLLLPEPLHRFLSLVLLRENNAAPLLETEYMTETLDSAALVEDVCSVEQWAKPGTSDNRIPQEIS